MMSLLNTILSCPIPKSDLAWEAKPSTQFASNCTGNDRHLPRFTESLGPQLAGGSSIPCTVCGKWGVGEEETYFASQAKQHAGQKTCRSDSTYGLYQVATPSIRCHSIPLNIGQFLSQFHASSQLLTQQLFISMLLM